MLRLIKDSNAAEVPVVSFHQGDYVKSWNGEDISWKWRDFGDAGLLMATGFIGFASGSIVVGSIVGLMKVFG